MIHLGCYNCAMGDSRKYLYQYYEWLFGMGASLNWKSKGMGGTYNWIPQSMEERGGWGWVGSSTGYREECKRTNKLTTDLITNVFMSTYRRKALKLGSRGLKVNEFLV